MTTIYTTTGVSTGMGRDGAVAIDGEDLRLDVARPGGDRQGTNPEQLFALGYAACFHSALKSLGSAQKLSVRDSEVHVTVDLVKGDEGFSIAAAIAATLPALTDEQAQGLVEAAHEHCPYSKATRGNIPVRLSGRGG